VYYLEDRTHKSIQMVDEQLYLNTETYLHKCAKAVLRSWFRRHDKLGVPMRITGHGEIIFKPDEKLGVLTEYPLAPYSLGWLWKHNPKYKGLPNQSLVEDEFIPTYKQCCQMGDTPEAILDVVCVDGTEVKYIFEISHRMPISREKVALLINYTKRHPRLECYEIDAIWIMNHTEVPNQISVVQKLI
jgi:hypothetical protein